MTKRMLIDAAHREETRVVVADGTQIDDFDFESEAKKQIKGNIYLARVTRVEPSLQAAFVEYGGNRHGFLAFSEIHPDYYQIPVADRERLLAMEAEAEARRAQADDEADEEEDDDEAEGDDELQADADLQDDDEDEDEDEDDEEEDLVASAEDASEDEDDDEDDEDGDDDDDRTVSLAAKTPSTLSSDEVETPETEASEEADESDESDDAEEDGADDETESAADEDNGESEDAGDDTEASSESEEEDEDGTSSRPRRGRRGGRRRSTRGSSRSDASKGKSSGNGRRRGGGRKRSNDEDEDLSRDPRPFFKNYKIQEVIRRRQVLLVQVAKEERGNKGAALTTYLSLPGRYCVLMPNTARGGGISRKITNVSDRKRLKAIVAELDVPKGMGLIVRTAGANRTKAEIKRDYDYLIRLWEEIRGLTLKSSAPSMIYEEGNLIKRSIRDLYTKDIEEVLVEGKEAYTEAKAFMKMLMPSHARNVKLYTERMPLYQRYHVDVQLDSMLSPRVDLPSGGYIIINQTEALVSVDVNSGKSTREHNIEQTALKTNLEASTELARQLRLRDLAGLIVIDFIDMEENRNNRAVERQLKKCLEHDRARLQVGRISNFGLLEMSRQRLRAGILEGSTRPCPHCEGAGIVRSVESAALRILRACGEEGARERSASITVTTNRETAEFILNHKRRQLLEFEDHYGMKTIVNVDRDLVGDEFEIERGEPLSELRRNELRESETVSLDTAYLNEDDDEDVVVEAVEDETEVEAAAEADAEADTDADDDKSDEAKSEATAEEKSRRRRRGRRGGRRNRRRREKTDDQNGEQTEAASGNEDQGDNTPSAPAPERQLESVGAAPSGSEGPGAGDDDGKKGWWQRRWF